MDVEYEDLVALGKYVKRPWSYLLIDTAETLPGAGDDHRTVANQRAGLSAELAGELEAADFLLDGAIELFSEDRFTVPVLPPGDLPAGRVAEAIRSFLDVSITEQLNADDEYAALRLWIAAIHGRGAYVSQRRLADDTIRAFSKVRDEQAVIVIDTGDTPYARIFSALHEYCHLTLRDAGVCDLDDHSTVERYCNAVAAAALLPPALLAGRVSSSDFTADELTADEMLYHLSRQLHVSQATILIALRDRSVISQDTYDAMEMRRRARHGSHRSPGGNYYRTEINKVGRLFARRVVDAMSDSVIDRQDASILLGIGEHNVDNYVIALAKATERDRD